MRMFSLLCGCVLLIATFSVAGAGDEKKTIKPKSHWGGLVDDKNQQTAAPTAGYLTSQKAFQKLWDTWGVKGKAPEIDFTKQLVFVQIAAGPNSIGTTYKLDAKGDLTAKSAQTLKAGPGFGYGLDLLDRDGIKSYNGKAIK